MLAGQTAEAGRRAGRHSGSIGANRKLDGGGILMLSAKGCEGDRRKRLELGTDDCVTKPFSTRGLVERAGALLGLPSD
jgi:DNA-binding response OmpR family regulator